jgi:hypothetical protein
MTVPETDPARVPSDVPVTHPGRPIPFGTPPRAAKSAWRNDADR